MSVRRCALAFGVWIASCGGEAAPPTPPPLPVPVPSPPAAPAPTVPALASLTTEPTWSGVLFQVGAAAPGIVRLIEPCFDVRPLPADLHVGISIGAEGRASAVRVTPDDAALAACALDALSPMRISPPGDPLLGDIDLAVHVRARTPEDPPREPVVWPERPEDLCERDRECVLVTGSCTGPVATTQRRADELDEAGQRALASRTCSGDAITPVIARCRDLVCATAPSDHPEWRACRTSSECVNVPRRCGEWDVVSRRFQTEARAAFDLEPEAAACTVAPDREGTRQTECRYGFCAFDWFGS
jgi:hypothetical protein